MSGQALLGLEAANRFALFGRGGGQAVEATRRRGSGGITANAVHPGTIATTNLSRHLDPDVLAALRVSAPYAEAFDASRVRYKTIEQGAATSVLVATSPQLDGIARYTRFEQ